MINRKLMYSVRRPVQRDGSPIRKNSVVSLHRTLETARRGLARHVAKTKEQGCYIWNEAERREVLADLIGPPL